MRLSCQPWLRRCAAVWFGRCTRSARDLDAPYRVPRRADRADRRRAMGERIGIGIVTGGGDCPGLNAVVRAATKAAARRGWYTIGFLGGFDGILDPQRFVELDHRRMAHLLTRGGTVLGTANR